MFSQVVENALDVSSGFGLKSSLEHCNSVYDSRALALDRKVENYVRTTQKLKAREHVLHMPM